MKKLLLILCAMALSVSAFAQKGESAAGINLNVSPVTEQGVKVTNFGIAAKYQYNILDPLRLEAVVGYDFKSKGVSVFDVGVNAHWLFNIGSKLKVYPLAGIGYANIDGAITIDEDEANKGNHGRPNYPGIYYSKSVDDDEDLSSSLSRFYFNVGAGVEYPITDRISACLEVKYQWMDNFSRVPVTLGVAYKF